MKIKSSYIFLKKEDKNNKTAKKKSDKNTDHKNVYGYISDAFPGIVHVSNDLTKRVCSYSAQIGSQTYQVQFVINTVVNITYLDIIVEGKTIYQAVRCMEEIQKILLSSGVVNEYVDIISYDAISEYYCNKILPKLNAFERNLRKLLFNTYIINFESSYYSKTLSKEFQDKVKSRIKADGNREAREIEQRKMFFYSLDYSDIQKMLFEKSWTPSDEEEKARFLSEHSDLTKLSDEEIRNAFSEFTSKSDWERLFSEKIKDEDIQDKISKLHQSRNNVAHFKFFDYKSYTETNNIINQLNKAVDNAIKLTEEEDFANKNNKYLGEALADAFLSFVEVNNISISGFLDSLAVTGEKFKSIFSPANCEKIRKNLSALYMILGSIMLDVGTSDNSDNKEIELNDQDESRL